MDTMDSRDAQWTALTATVASLEAKFAASEAKVAAMERARRAERVRAVAALIVCAALAFICALSVGVHAQTTPQTLVCKELRVVGDNGKTRVLLSYNTDDCGLVQTYNPEGTLLTSMAATSGSNHDGSIGTYSNATGKHLVVISAVKHDRDDRYDGSLETFTADGKNLVEVATDHKDAGTINVYDKDSTFIKSFP